MRLQLRYTLTINSNRPRDRIPGLAKLSPNHRETEALKPQFGDGAQPVVPPLVRLCWGAAREAEARQIVIAAGLI